MHFAFDNWQLAVPRLAVRLSSLSTYYAQRRIQASCRLEDCLDEYTRLEILKDCICRKCSVLSTHHRLLREVLTLEEATKPEAKPSSSKKRRLKEVKRMEARVKAAITQGRIEDDLKDIRLEKVTSPASTKQSMIARVRPSSLTKNVANTPKKYKAPTHTRTPHQPLRALWSIRLQKHYQAHIPRSPRPNTLHHLREPLHRPHVRHINSTTRDSPQHNADAQRRRGGEDDIQVGGCGVSLWTAFFWALCCLSEETTEEWGWG